LDQENEPVAGDLDRAAGLCYRPRANKLGRRRASGGTNPVSGEKPNGTPHDNRFADLTYEDFRRLAVDPSLSCCEKIGFPDSYREGKEGAIFRDILGKLTALGARRKTVLDVGPGCSGLAHLLVEHCERQGHTLLLVDSPEMLAHLPDRPFVRKVPGYFPRCPAFLGEYAHRIDAVLTYSVAQYAFVECSIFEFVDRTLTLLAPGGELLIGDVPNVSIRKRFFSSAAGVAYHQRFVGRAERPAVAFNQPEPGKIDDSVVLALLLRARLAGYDSYVLPQGADLPMSNRREDLLIRRP
jgi:hypothetical protein